MYKNLLQQIANTIFINIQHVKQSGLLEGKLGIALFFYHYAKYTQNEMYSNLSDSYIEFIYDKLGKDSSLSFSKGIAGIGWGLDYCIKQGFVESDDDDDILEEVDDMIKQLSYTNFTSDLEDEIPLFTKGLYFLQRGKNEIILETLVDCSKFLELINNEYISISYLNSIFYFINKTVELNIDTELSNLLINKLFINYSQNIQINTPSITDRFILSRNIENIANPDIRKEWRKMLPLENDVQSDLFAIAGVDFLYKYSDSNNRTYNVKDISPLIKDKIHNLNENELSIYNGLAGIGLEILQLA
ncbi:lanthionine synthetase LanC family protein [Dysgonomonas sp. 25]|uniref:lanthionine synthetase LanC family protein n=1 Tax=Dysgonomonas sp. 25 TaxID=2302933 RepID=UPI0013D16108|nr:lanthionine synthetase LanC family protein [Dysgonomonas sp. 25]NDV67916.1 hypothetical protein [Dysgonomonas sp. 25]